MIQKEQLKQYLLTCLIDAKEASGGKEIVCRCTFCNDLKRHLYIGPFDDSDNPIVYNCFKCRESGIVDKNFLDDYGVSIELEDDSIINSNKGTPYKSKGLDKDIFYNLRYTYISDIDISRTKLNYINWRLGTNITYQDCIENKIVLNLLDLLNENGIKRYTRHEDIVHQLNQNFIGFLSRANSTLSMRNLNQGKVQNSIDQKYINYKIFDNVPQNDYYILPNIIDRSKHIKIYIAEGAFDILGIYFNLIRDKTNSIYIAGKGKSYDSALKWVITTYGIYDAEVHLFPDTDVPDYMMYNISNLYKVYGMQFYMHRNSFENEKDFGVPQSRIIDKCIRI